MTEFDDFEWVDHPSGEVPGQARSSDTPDNRDYTRPRGNVYSSGSARSEDPARNGRAINPVAPPRVVDSSSAPGTQGSRSMPSTGSSSRTRTVTTPSKGARSPRHDQQRYTLWSRIGAGSRSLLRRMARLPRPVLIAAACVVFLVILTMVIDSAIYYNKIHAGVSVAGQGLSGRTTDQAAVLLAQKIEETRALPITVVSGTQSWTITPDELDQAVDIEATVSAAMDVTRRSNLITDLARRLKLYFDGEDLPLIGTVDETKFDAFLSQIAGDLDVQPINAGLIIQDDFSMTAVEGVSGFVVDQDSLHQQLLDALFLHNTAEIRVPMIRKAPDVMADDSEYAIAQVRTMLSDSVQLEYIGLAPPPTTTTTEAGAATTTSVTQPTSPELVKTTLTRTFSPAEIAAYIDFKAENIGGVMTLIAYVSAEKMAPFLDSIERPMKVDPADAYFTSDGANVWVEEMVLGKGLDHEGTAQALTEAALRSTDRTAEAIFLDIEPDFTTQEALDMHITDQLGRYHTHFKSVYWEREHNVRKAAEEAGNKLLAPGEEYDFEKYLSDRTRENALTPENPSGWAGAVGIQDGVLTEGVLGGGICQVSTTLFNAVFEAGLEITERWNHSLFIDHYPAGLDATVTGGGKPKNLRFVNNTDGYIWIWSQSDGTDTTFIIFGTDDGREVQAFILGPYDVTERPVDFTITTLDPGLPANSTTVVQSGQDDMKYKVTREITWPNGSTTTDIFLSEWEMKPEVIAFPTSTTSATTTTTLPIAPTTTPQITGG